MRASATSRISSHAAAYGVQPREVNKADPTSPFALLMQSAAPSANDKPAPKDDGKAANDKNEPAVAAKPAEAGDAEPLPKNQPAESKDSRATTAPAKTDEDEREPAEQEVATVDPSLLAPIQPMPLPPAIPLPQAAPPSPDMSIPVADDDLTITAPVASQPVKAAPSAPMIEAAVPDSNPTPPPDQASAPQPDDKAAAPQNPAPAQPVETAAQTPPAAQPIPAQSPDGPSIPVAASAPQKPNNASTDQTAAVAAASAEVVAATSAAPAPGPALKMPPAQSPVAAQGDAAKADPTAGTKPAPAKAGTVKPAQADDGKSETIARLAHADAVKPGTPDAGNTPPKAPSTVPDPVTALAAPQAQPAQTPMATASPLNIQVTAQPHGAAPNLPALAVEIAAKSQSGAKQFDIRLDPPELGRVEVRLSIDATGKASAHLSADQRQTLDLLQKDAPALTRALREAGLQVSEDGLNFSLRQQAGDSGAQGQAGRRAPRGAALSATASLSSSPTSAPMGSRMVADGRLDIRV